jgi:pimeloyl-ACP methyl ester carboxylesterase
MPVFVNSLISKGFRVLLYDLYGRGYSDAPGVDYSTDLYVSQLEGILDAAGWSNEKCFVVGYSLGGGIATAFTAKWGKSKVERLGLLAPAGLLKELPLAGKIVSVPVFGDLFGHLFGRMIVSKGSLKNHDPKTINEPHMVSGTLKD